MNRRFVSIAALLAVLAPIARGDDAPKKHVLVGETVPAFSAKDTADREVTSASLRAVTDESVAAAIRAAAGFDAAKVWKADDSVDSVPAARGEHGAIDAAKRLAFLRAAGRDFGLLLDAASSSRLKTLGDVSAWLKKASDAPIVLVFWFSRCPSAKGYADRLVTLSAEHAARVYPVASNSNEKIEGVKAAEAEYGYRVLMDPDRKLCDLLGGRKTPHAFVVDAKGVLRYSGAIDDDFPEELGPEKRHSWLDDAVRALIAGKPVPVAETAPEGCSIKR